MSFEIGQFVEFDYTCEDGTSRHRKGMVESVGATFIRLKLEDGRIRTAAIDRITNLTETAPTGWASV